MQDQTKPIIKQLLNNKEITALRIEYSDLVFICRIAEPIKDFLVINFSDRTQSFGMLPSGFLKRGGQPRHKETILGREIDRVIRPLINEAKIVDIYTISRDKNLSNDRMVQYILQGMSEILLLKKYIDEPLNIIRLDIPNVKFGVVTLYKNFIIGLSIQSNGVNYKDIAKQIQANCPNFTNMGWKYQGIENKIEPGVNYRKNYLQVTKTVLDYFFDTGKSKDINFFLEMYPDFYDGMKFAYLNEIKNGNRIGGRNSFTDVRTRVVEDDTFAGVNNRFSIVGYVGAPASEAYEKGMVIRASISCNPLNTSQILDATDYDEKYDDFIVHYYNCAISHPEFVGKRVSKRELGHANLIKSGLNNFDGVEGMVISIDAEVMIPNGGTSMFSTTLGSILLYNAGLTDKVITGNSSGLILKDNSIHRLSDITYTEDLFGMCDIKVSSHEDNIYAIQADFKDIKALHISILEEFLSISIQDNKKIYNQISKYINRSLINLPIPKVYVYKTKDSKNVGKFIGKMGVNIKEFTSKFNVSVDVEDLKLKIFSDQEISEECKSALKSLNFIED